MRLVVNVVTYLDLPTTVKIVDEVRVPKKVGQGSKKQKGGVKYIYKTIYKVKEVINPTGRQNKLGSVKGTNVFTEIRILVKSLKKCGLNP